MINWAHIYGHFLVGLRIKLSNRGTIDIRKQNFKVYKYIGTHMVLHVMRYINHLQYMRLTFES